MSASQTTIICGVTCDCAVKPAVTQAASATGCEAKTGCKFASAGQCSCAAGVCQASAAKQTCKKATSGECSCAAGSCQEMETARASCAQSGSCGCAPGTCLNATAA